RPHRSPTPHFVGPRCRWLRRVSPSPALVPPVRAEDGGAGSRRQEGDVRAATTGPVLRELAGLTFGPGDVTPEELLASGDAALARLLPAEDAFWIGVDFEAGTVAVSRHGVPDPQLGAALAPVVA